MDTPENQITPPGGDERAEFYTEAIKEHGGPTKENLVLTAFGYALKALDHFQARTAENNMLPLTDQQHQVLVMLATDVGVMCAKQAAIQAKAGEPMEEWASITEVEANGIALANLDAMIETRRRVPVVHPQPTPDEPTS